MSNPNGLPSLSFDTGIKVTKVVETTVSTVTPRTVIIDLIARTMQIHTEEGGQTPIIVPLAPADVASLLPRIAKYANTHFARLAKDDAAEQARRNPKKVKPKRAAKKKP